jgi:hypothetical protein
VRQLSVSSGLSIYLACLELVADPIATAKKPPRYSRAFPAAFNTKGITLTSDALEIAFQK